MVGIGIVLLLVGLLLWLTVMPAIGWTLMAIGVAATEAMSRAIRRAVHRA